MIDNISQIEGASRIPVVEPAKKGAHYDQKNIRKKLGEYLIDNSLGGRIVGRKIIDNYLDNVNLDQEYGEKKDNDQGKKKKKKLKMPWQKKEKIIKVVDPEELKKSRFFNITKAHNERIITIVRDARRHFETTNDLLLDNPLKMGIVYQILDEDKPGIIDSDRAINVIQGVLQSEKFKSIYKTTLEALGEVVLAKFSQAGFGEREANPLRELLMDNPDFAERAIRMGVAPTGDTTVEDWKNVFIDLFNYNPAKLLEQYFGHYRLEEGDYNANLKNTFKLGQMAVETSEVGKKQSLIKYREASYFLDYHDRERNFEGEHYWEDQIFPDKEDKITSAKYAETLLPTAVSEGLDRTTQSLVETGNARVKNNVLEYESEFIKIFGELNERNDGKNDGMLAQDRFALGVLYSMRDQLGVGALPKEEVLQRAKNLIPSIRRLGRDIAPVLIKDNFDQFYRPLAYMASMGHFGEEIKQKCLKIYGRESLEEADFDLSLDIGKKVTLLGAKIGAVRRLNKIEFRLLIEEILKQRKGEFLNSTLTTKADQPQKDIFLSLVNSSHVNGFNLGSEIGKKLNGVAAEQYKEAVEDFFNVYNKITDENAVIELLTRGEYIKDPQVRSRAERSFKKTSRLGMFAQRISTKTRVFFQSKLFYKEGESPFMAKPSLKTEGAAVAKSAAITIAFGQFVNHFLEDPVNRGQEGMLFMGGYFLFKEGGAVIKEIKARQKHDEYIPQKSTKLKEKFSKNFKPWLKHKLKEDKYFRQSAWENRKDIGRLFWHNKGKYALSMGVYMGTSTAINVGLQHLGITGPGGLSDPETAPLIMMAFNTGVSGLLSGVGLRTGAESIINIFHRKKVIDQGLETIMGQKTEVSAPVQAEEKPEISNPEIERKRLRNKNALASIWRNTVHLGALVGLHQLNMQGLGGLTNIEVAPMVLMATRPGLATYLLQPLKSKAKNDLNKVASWTQQKILDSKIVQKAMGREPEQIKKLQLLQDFITNKNNPKRNFKAGELKEVSEFLNWMKEEEALLLIHNPHFYGERKIHRPDGGEGRIENKEAMKKIDETREDILRYAQKRLPYKQYKNLLKVSLSYDTDVKNIRKKLWKRRLQFTAASYGYRVAFMGLTYMFENISGTNNIISKVLGDNTRHHQAIIDTLQAPATEVFHIQNGNNVEAANEVAARYYELNNLIILMNTDRLSSTQAVIDNNIAYNGLNQVQIEGLINALKGPDGKSNLGSFDLMRVIYSLSTYKEGQDYLAEVAKVLDGTDHKSLAPLVEYFAKNNPVSFMEKAATDKHLGSIIALKYPDLAAKLHVAEIASLDQLDLMGAPESVKQQVATSPISFFDLKQDGQTKTFASVDNFLTTFVDGLPTDYKHQSIDFLIQCQGIISSDVEPLHQAVGNHFSEFLADSRGVADKNLTMDLINKQASDSIIYKIFHSIPENMRTTQLIDLIDKAKKGDAASYNEVYKIIQENHSNNVKVEQVFSVRQNVDVGLYRSLLSELPNNTETTKSEILLRIKSSMINELGLRPIDSPDIDVESMVKLNLDPELFISPDKALSYALSHQVSDLDLLLSLQGDMPTIFIENGDVVGVYHSTFRASGNIGEDALRYLNLIEGSESKNSAVVIPTLLVRNIKYIFGLGPSSGASTPAVSLVEMMTGGFEQNPINPNEPSALHHYSKYGLDYLMKLVIAQVRGRVPDDLVSQMNPQTSLNEKIPEHQSYISLLCYKFESFIAARQLVANYGEDAVHKAYLDNVFLGTVNGIEVRGANSASQILFGESFESLSQAKQFLIVSLGQAPNPYLYDYNIFGQPNLDADGKMIPSPTNGIDHALKLLEGKIGSEMNLDEKNRIIQELLVMKDQSEKDGWQTVFKGGLKLPEGVNNFADTNQAVALQGLSREALQEHIKSGEVVSMRVTSEGLVVVLNNTPVESVGRVVPTQVIFPDMLSPKDEGQAQLAITYSGMFSDDNLNGNFYEVKTNDGKIDVPAWYVGKDIAVPGMATMEFRDDGSFAFNDPTNTLSKNPQLFGSGFKPLVALFALREHPEYINPQHLDQYKLNFSPGYYDGLYVTNSTNTTNMAGPHDLKYVLSASGNVGMADLWTRMVKEDPGTWNKFQEFSHQFGIYYYEFKNGEFVPLSKPPLADVGYGNIYVGGPTADDSGMKQMAQFYHDLGVMAFKGEGDPKQVEAAKYVVEALQNPEYKKEIPIWSPQNMEDLSPDCGSGSSCFFKTGTQSGVGPGGTWIAIRMGTYGVKYNPADGSVTSVVVLAAGKDPQGNPVELGWASGEIVPVARRIIESVGVHSSAQMAGESLNNVFFNKNENYSLGTISVEELYKFIKSQGNRDLYLEDSIRRGETKNLFIDLIGKSNNGVQTIAIHLNNNNGDKLYALNVPADLIHSVGSENINNSFDKSAQEIIYSLMEQAAVNHPETYASILQEMKLEGVNIIPVYGYETSPLLFSIHEQMMKNHFLTMGPEDGGAIMAKLGLDPSKTIFVNGELLRGSIGYPVDDNFGKLNDMSQVIVDQIIIERHYLQMENIYQMALMSMNPEERSGFGDNLDQLLYANGTSNQSYQLLRLFVDINANKQALPVGDERMVLINNFERMINGPKAGEAPDVVRAFNAFKILSEQMERGENPDPSLSRDLVQGLKRFPETTQSQVMVNLGLQTPSGGGVRYSPISLSPEALVNNATPLSSELAANEILNVFIAHPERFSMTPGEKIKVGEMLKTADVIIDAVNNNQGAQPEELKRILILEIENKLGLKVDPGLEQLISQYTYGMMVNGERQKQCVQGFMVINRILHEKGLAGFPDMEGLGGDGAGDFMGPLREHVPGNEGEYLMPSYEVERAASVPGESLLYKFIHEISQIKVGDTLLIRTTWLDKPNKDDPGHIAQVLFSGVDKNNNPYLIVFDTNGDSKGTTQIRIISDLDQLVPQVARDVQPLFPGAEPLFAIIRAVEPNE
ncbi:MAG: transglycosylase domain-containing protein [Patescibacteria group bacterium]|jgi:hypothetical protein